MRTARKPALSYNRLASLTSLAAVLHNLLLQVGVFLAWDQADLLQRHQVLFGLRKIMHHEVCLTDVLVCAAVAWVELQRALIVPEGEIELAGVAISVAEIVLDVSIARVAQRRRVERLDRRRPILGVDRLLTRCVIRIELHGCGIVVSRVGRSRARPQGEPGDGEQRDRGQLHGWHKGVPWNQTEPPTCTASAGVAIESL